MRQSETETRPSLGAIIEALHESEINGSVSWFFDEVWTVVLGDPQGGIDAEATVASPREAAEWLRATAVRLHPDSKFAKRFHPTGK
jgi:hypothetical protein